MLEPIRHILEKQTIILASQSPRRQQILTNVGFPYKPMVSGFKEDLDYSRFSGPSDYAVETGRCKAHTVLDKLNSEKSPCDVVVVACDTVVVVGEDCLGKPNDRHHAFDMLSRMSGGVHSVISGVTILLNNTLSPHKSEVVERCFHEVTQVHMTHLTPAIIEAYLDTGEPMDKAGGYGIQGVAGTLIERVEGCYFNVMGFPLHRFCKELIKLYEDQGIISS